MNEMQENIRATERVLCKVEERIATSSFNPAALMTYMRSETPSYIWVHLPSTLWDRNFPPTSNGDFAAWIVKVRSYLNELAYMYDVDLGSV